MEQRAAFPAAKDTADAKDVLKAIVKTNAAKGVAAIAALCAACATAVYANRVGWLSAARITLRPATALVLSTAKAVLDVLAGPAAQRLGGRVLTRLVDYAVPAVVVVFALSALGGDDESSPQEDEGGVLKKLLKGGKATKAAFVPATEYIHIESLGDKHARSDANAARPT